MNAKDICFLEEKEILTVDRKHLLYSINLKVMLTEELKRYKKKIGGIVGKNLALDKLEA